MFHIFYLHYNRFRILHLNQDQEDFVFCILYLYYRNISYFVFCTFIIGGFCILYFVNVLYEGFVFCTFILGGFGIL